MPTNQNGGDPDWAVARRNFEAVWDPGRWRYMSPSPAEPTVADLLGIDREYRVRSATHEAADEAPPQLRLQRNHRHYLARFAGRRRDDQRDWVILQVDGATPGRSYTVTTGEHALLQGKRVVRGRERECLAYYRGLGLTTA